MVINVSVSPRYFASFENVASRLGLAKFPTKIVRGLGVIKSVETSTTSWGRGALKEKSVFPVSAVEKTSPSPLHAVSNKRTPTRKILTRSRMLFRGVDIQVPLNRLSAK